MRLLEKTKDGGSESPVEAYFLFESKRFGSIALLKFNEGGRENFHTHAFNAYTWFLWGDLTEQKYCTYDHQYKRSWKPKFTSRDNNHRVYAWSTSWCFTIRGPWVRTWTEHTPSGEKITLGHGRIVLNEEYYKS